MMMKNAQNLVSFDPANFEMSKLYQGNIQSNCYFAQLFLDTLIVTLHKMNEIVGEFFLQF